MVAGVAESRSVRFAAPPQRRVAPRRSINSLSCSSWGKICRKEYGVRSCRWPAEVECAFRLAADPEVDGRQPCGRVRSTASVEVKLTVEFQCPRLHRQRARGGAGLRGLVDNPHSDAELGQPQRQNQPGRASADDQHIAAHLDPMLCFFRMPAQNSLGPCRSSFAVRVITVAAAIINAIPARLTASCIANPPEIF